MFADDRDLVVLEPGLFSRVSWAGQRVIEATANGTGSTLTFSGFDIRELGVSSGSVLMVEGAPLEVIKVSSGTTCTVSRVRGRRSDDSVSPRLSGTVVVRGWTFRPQVSMVHGWLLAMLGLTDPAGPGEGAVKNPEDLVLVEALGALHLVFAGASALAGAGGDGVREASSSYAARFVRERGRAVARLDLDGDGVADAARRLSLVTLGRG